MHLDPLFRISNILFYDFEKFVSKEIIGSSFIGSSCGLNRSI